MWQAILLGIVQGITEFLPISSDGHLVIVQHFLGLKDPLLTFDIFIHLGTLAAVLLYFRKLIASYTVGLFIKERQRESVRLVLMVAWATVPAVIVGLLLKDLIEETFGSAVVAALSWFVMGILLIASTRIPNRKRGIDEVGVADAWWIGVAQVFALLPGISRSGMTIITGLYCGLAPVEAARFSFLMAIPAIAGAAVLQLKDVDQTGLWTDPIMLAGAVSAFLVGMVAISFLLRMLNTGNLRPFGIYCIGASLVAFGLMIFE